MEKIFVVSLGCPKNLADTEKILFEHFKNYLIVTNPEEADVFFINTCSFILPAKEESIDTIFEFVEYKKKFPDKRVIVSGCLLEQYGGELEKEIPEAEFLSNKGIFLTQGRVITTRAFSYLKIAEGCSRKCAFCTIPLFKGTHKSRELNDILSEAKEMEGSVQELIIVSQDTSFYGMDSYKTPKLYDLLSYLSDMDFPWIRVMYFYPENLTDSILDLIASRPNICNYIDIPFQHLSDPILKKMKRWGSYEQYKNIVSNIRSRIPESSIRTSFIVGFPGETQKDYETLLGGLDEFQFNRVGFFSYSDEPETASFRLEGKVEEEEKEKRISQASFIQEEISEEILKGRIGKIYKVLEEGYDPEKEAFYGRTEFEAPEIDGLVYFQSDKKTENNFKNILITDSDQHNLSGREV